jgi:hypothetical protein
MLSWPFSLKENGTATIFPLHINRRNALDAEAEVYVLLVAGVSVEVVRGAAVELVALAEFASDEQAESYRSEAGGDPAYGFDEGGFFFAVLGLFRKRENAGGGDVLGCGGVGAGCGAKLHDIG